MAAWPADAATPPSDAREQQEKESPLDRMRDYVERNGVRGRIDPDWLLQVTREVYAERSARRRIRSDIQGTMWRSIGPANGGGRATSLSPHPTAAGVVYVGTAGGGLWKLTATGATYAWTPLTDFLPNLSVGAVAVAPSAPETIYLGSGEGGITSSAIPGIGLLVSGDGGQTWAIPDTRRPHPDVTQIYSISVHPANRLELVVGTNKGAWRSTNGLTGPWTEVIRSAPLIADGYGDVTQIVRDPDCANTLYATTFNDGASCSGTFRDCEPPTILRSIDGGETWSSTSEGDQKFPRSTAVNRIALALDPAAREGNDCDHRTIYAATSIAAGGDELAHIYKSVDGGRNWTDTSLAANGSVNHYFSNPPPGGPQTHYDNTIVVAPARANSPGSIYAGGIHYVQSNDAGGAWAFAAFENGSDPHVDAHDFAFDAAGTLFIACDGGVWSSDGATATPLNDGLVTRQFYSIANHPSDPHRVIGGQQDNGTSLRPGPTSSWTQLTGGDGIGCAYHPDHSDVAYVTAQNGYLYRVSGGSESYIAPPYATDEPSFNTIVAVHPEQPSALYTLTHRLWRSNAAGEPGSWSVVSGTADWSAASKGTALAIAPSDPAVLYAARYKTSGLLPASSLMRSTDGGATWVDAGDGLPSLRRINSIDVDPANPLVAYAAIGGAGTTVYATTDGGESWTPAATGLPDYPAQVVRVDPTSPTTLYCGTLVGIYESRDRGATWEPFHDGMPAVAVYDIRIARDGSLMRAATHGRGVWELDVQGTTNRRPVAAIETGTTVVATGTTLQLAGSTTDPDAGDTVRGRWTFPDDWSSVSVAGGATAVPHTFNRGGTFEVALAAIDSHGVAGTDVVTIRVSGLQQPDASSEEQVALSGMHAQILGTNLAGVAKALTVRLGPSQAPLSVILCQSDTPFTMDLTGDQWKTRCSGADALVYGALPPFPEPSVPYDHVYPLNNANFSDARNWREEGGYPFFQRQKHYAIAFRTCCNGFRIAGSPSSFAWRTAAEDFHDTADHQSVVKDIFFRLSGVDFVDPLLLTPFLDVAPGTGAAPLASTLTAAVAGGDPSASINYSFWWNCADARTDVAAVSAVCGDPSLPANGAKLDGASAATQAVTHTYPLGSHRSKVIIERGSSAPVTAFFDVNAGAPHPTAPRVVSMTARDPNPCNCGYPASYDLKFSKPVTGLTLSDFTVTYSGENFNAGPWYMSGSGSDYIITIEVSQTDGTAQLHLVDDDTVRDANGNPLGGIGRGNGNFDGETYTIDHIPSVSVNRAMTSPARTRLVTFSASFNEPVLGVEARLFRPVVVYGSIVAPTVVGLSGSGAAYTVTVDVGTGNGAIRVDFVDDDTVRDVTGHPIGGPGTGEMMGASWLQIAQTPASVMSIRRIDSNPTRAPTVAFEIAFDSYVGRVDVADLALTTTGITGASIDRVTRNSACCPLFTAVVNTGTGNGTLRLDVVDDDSIVDVAGNPLGGPGAGNGDFRAGETYDVDKTETIAGTLEVSPATGTAPLAVTLAGTVTGGTAEGPMHYTFWWNCADPASTVAAATVACGDPASSTIGARFTSVAATTQSVVHAYDRGTYTAKLLIERGAAARLAKNATVTVTCPVLQIEPATLPSAVAGSAYQVTFSGAGGGATWTITGVPNGLSATGNTLSGTPASAGTSTITVTAAANGCSATRDYTLLVTNAAGAAPTSLVATANSAGQVALTWIGVANVSHYEIVRGTVTIGTSGVAGYVDNGCPPATTCRYTVRAISVGGAASPSSNADLATTIAFTDDPLVAGASPVRAAHILQLRAAVNSVRAAAALPPFAFSGTIASGAAVEARHVQELRTALGPAASILGVPLPAFTRSLVPGASIHAVDITELRTGTK